MLWHSHQNRPIRAARLARSVTASVILGALVLAGCSADKPKPNTPPSRILQSVAVQMAADGTTTGINGTTVSVHSNAADATTEKQTYSPQDVANDLPVRLGLAYRTADKTGTDLNDLAGYDGRIEIDLTVQNLTVRPQKLTYDVAGTRQTRTALVGSPLTVVASTAMPKTTPTQVITASADGGNDVTNGILSQSEDGGSVIQWAALLASPQLGTSATLRLVTDAKDFQVPTFDLSVQPGLVTDPSVRGVLESAFDTNPASQLALEQRTIKVIAQVNQVLTQASDNISGVRKNLDSTSETLGKNSVQQLQTSTKGVADSMKGLDSELKSLSSDIASTLDGTQSTVLDELGKTVSVVDSMLGDTTATPPKAKTDGKGCQTVVAKPKEAASVYGNLMQVTAQLDGYATATGACKKEAQTALLHSVGPKDPNAATCPDSDATSTTCALFLAQQSFTSIMDNLVKKGDELAAGLQPQIVTDASKNLAGLEASMKKVSDAATSLKDFDPHAGLTSGLDTLSGRLDDAESNLSDLNTQIQNIHTEAVTAKTAIRGDSQNTDPDSGYGKNSMLAQNAELAAGLCELKTGGLVDDLKVEQLRAYLVSKACDGSTPLVPPVGSKNYDGPMDQRLGTQADAWDKIITLTDAQQDQQANPHGIAAALAGLKKQLDGAKGDLDSLTKDVQDGQQGYDDRLKTLESTIDELTGGNVGNPKSDSDLAKLQANLAKLASEQTGLADQIKTAFHDAADDANGKVEDAIKPQIRKVTTQAAVDSKAVGDMFDESAAGLSGAADKISDNGTRTINSQKQKLTDAEKRTRAAAGKEIDKSLGTLATGVSASTRDMNAASSQLTASLKKVLLDLGNPKVKGSGLLGAMATSAAKVGTADYQLALASQTTTSYANVRGEDINGILLRQAQLSATLQAGAEQPAFHLAVPEGAQTQTVYTFTVGGSR